MPCENQHEWLIRQVEHVDTTWPSALSPAVRDLEHYIENDTRLQMYFTAMWEEAEWKEPDGRKVVRDYHHMLILLDYISSRAPEWIDAEASTGLLGSPMYGLFEHAMGTVR